MRSSRSAGEVFQDTKTKYVSDFHQCFLIASLGGDIDCDVVCTRIVMVCKVGVL